jgi:hypothetical protein
MILPSRLHSALCYVAFHGSISLTADVNNVTPDEQLVFDELVKRGNFSRKVEKDRYGNERTIFTYRHGIQELCRQPGYNAEGTRVPFVPLPTRAARSYAN